MSFYQAPVTHNPVDAADLPGTGPRRVYFFRVGATTRYVVGAGALPVGGVRVAVRAKPHATAPNRVVLDDDLAVAAQRVPFVIGLTSTRVIL